MTPQIIKLKNAGAQSILNYALVRENTFVVQTKEKLKDDTPYVSAWGIAGPAFWRAAGPPAKASSPARRSPSTVRSRPSGRRSSTSTGAATTRTWTPPSSRSAPTTRSICSRR